MRSSVSPSCSSEYSCRLVYPRARGLAEEQGTVPRRHREADLPVERCSSALRFWRWESPTPAPASCVTTAKPTAPAFGALRPGLQFQDGRALGMERSDGGLVRRPRRGRASGGRGAEVSIPRIETRPERRSSASGHAFGLTASTAPPQLPRAADSLTETTSGATAGGKEVPHVLARAPRPPARRHPAPSFAGTAPFSSSTRHTPSASSVHEGAAASSTSGSTETPSISASVRSARPSPRSEASWPHNATW